MTDTNLVRIPWHDGTTREVPEGTICLTSRVLVFAAKDGFTASATAGAYVAAWGTAKVSKVYVEAPEPPLVVEVPTGIGAVVASAGGYLFVHHRNAWRDEDGVLQSLRDVQSILRDGGRVLYEGVDPEQVA